MTYREFLKIYKKNLKETGIRVSIGEAKLLVEALRESVEEVLLEEEEVSLPRFFKIKYGTIEVKNGLEAFERKMKKKEDRTCRILRFIPSVNFKKISKETFKGGQE